jgi:hypothetical protein
MAGCEMERRGAPKAGPMNVAAAFASTLLVSVAFCQTALGQTRPAIHVITVWSEGLAPGAGSAPGVGLAPLDGAPPCTAAFCKSIPRYENKGIVAITEYDTIPPCKYIDHGQWDPGTNLEPTSAGKPAGTVDVSEPAFIGPVPPGCTGGTYYYAPIYFKWTLRKNLTAVSGYGPTAKFISDWFTKDLFNTYTFQVTVPVVRPMGETTEWLGFGRFGLVPVGQWQQTLVPKPADAPFDFSGEEVKERFVGGTNSCRTPKFNVGTQAASRSTGSSWPVRALNKWGPDGVGFGGESDAICAMHYARCVQPTGCFGTKLQQMAIKSPADRNYTDYGKTNILLWGLTGGVIPGGQGLGLVESARAGQGPKSELYVTQDLYCAPYLKKQFPKCK